MEAWTIVVIALLILAIVIFIFLTYITEKKNSTSQQSNILYPFSGYLAPSNVWTVNQSKNNPGVGEKPEDGLYLVGMVGGESNNVPQIQCPAGYHINVVSAFLDVADPYGECSYTPDSVLKMTCGDGSDASSAPACSDPSDCGAGMTCYGGKCYPATCSSNSDCSSSSASGSVKACDSKLGTDCSQNNVGDRDSSGTLVCILDQSGNQLWAADPGTGACMACMPSADTGAPPLGSAIGYCASMPTCMFTEKGLNDNCTPSAGDTNKCRPRDASAYLANYCNGKTTCLGDNKDIWKPNSTDNNPFGPLPCEISATSTGADAGKYASLPVITGWGGGVPANSESNQSDPATFNQGYKIHGIFSCIPDSEDTSVTSS